VGRLRTGPGAWLDSRLSLGGRFDVLAVRDTGSGHTGRGRNHSVAVSDTAKADAGAGGGRWDQACQGGAVEETPVPVLLTANCYWRMHPDGVLSAFAPGGQKIDSIPSETEEDLEADEEARLAMPELNQWVFMGECRVGQD
jgi:hypothetical protein